MVAPIPIRAHYEHTPIAELLTPRGRACVLLICFRRVWRALSLRDRRYFRPMLVELARGVRHGH